MEETKKKVEERMREDRGERKGRERMELGGDQTFLPSALWPPCLFARLLLYRLKLFQMGSA